MTRCPQRSHCWTRPPRAAERQSEHVIPACQQIAVMRADVSAISGSRLKRWRLEIERIEPTGCGAHGYIGDVEIARRSFQIAWPSRIWMVPRLVPDSSRCVAKASRSEWGCTGRSMRQ